MSIPKSATQGGAAVNRKIVFAGLSGTPPRFIDEGPNKGLGWQEYESLEVRKALKRAGFKVQMEYMTPARIDYEFQAKNPICTWPVKWKDPNSTFAQKPDRIYSIPLNFEGDEVHSILYRQLDDSRFQKHRDQKGDLDLESLLHDKGLKTLFVQAADYGSLNSKLFTKDAKGNQIVRPEYSNHVMLLLIRNNQQLLEMLNGNRFDYIIADAIEDHDFKKTKIPRERFRKSITEVSRITTVHDPRLTFVSVACSDHPLGREAIPVMNQQIFAIRGSTWLDQKLSYMRRTNGESGQSRNVGSLTTLASLRGQFESGGSEYWYADQQKRFPGLLLFPGNPLEGDRNPTQAALDKKLKPTASLRWYLDQKLNNTVLIFNSASLPSSWGRVSLESRYLFEEVLSGRYFDPDVWQRVTEVLSGGDSSIKTRSADEFGKLFLPENRGVLNPARLVVFGYGLSLDDFKRLSSLFVGVRDLTIVGASRECSEWILSELPLFLRGLSLISCELNTSKIGLKIKELRELRKIDLTNSQVSSQQMRLLFEFMPPQVETLSFAYNRHAFLWDMADSMRRVSWPHLKELDLESTWLIDPHLGALKESLPKGIRRLNLNKGAFSPRALSSFFRRSFPEMAELRISDSALGFHLDQTIELPPSVRVLEVSGTRLNSENIGRILFPRNLNSLDLSNNDLGGDGLKKVLPFLAPRLRLLALQETHLTEKEIQILFGAQRIEEIEELDLSINGLNDQALQILSDSKLKVGNLNLSQNMIQNQGAVLLAERLAPGLKSLSLASNPISGLGFCKLTERLSTKVEQLNVERIFEFEASCLADFLKRSKDESALRELSFGGNQLAGRDTELILKSLPKSLFVLSLADSDLSRTGLRAFIQWGPRNLRELDMSKIALSEEDQADLLRALPKSVSHLRIGPIVGSQAPQEEPRAFSGQSLSDLLPALRRMSIEGLFVDRSASKLGARFPHTLRHLSLHKVRGEIGLAQGLNESHLESLRRLYLEAGSWSAASRRFLLSSLHPSLESLSILGVGLNDQEIGILGRLSLGSLNTLQLRSNPIHSRALVSFVKAHREIRSLAISGSAEIDDDFFNGLSQGDLKDLREFQGANCNVTGQGWVGAFQKFPPYLARLAISNTRVRPEDVGPMLSAFPKYFFGVCLARGLAIGEVGREKIRRYVDERERETGIRIEFAE